MSFRRGINFPGVQGVLLTAGGAVPQAASPVPVAWFECASCALKLTALASTHPSLVMEH